jgi:hypothetical protein
MPELIGHGKLSGSEPIILHDAALPTTVTPTRFWDQDVGDYVGERKRHADVYVFCLHAHQDRATLNPLDVRQWRFFAAPTRLLDTHLGVQKTVGLRTLQRIGVTEVAYGAIDTAITRLAGAMGDAR